ncbi:hypothetical protein JKG41_15545, partial [Acidithiobacillus sp. MC2.1]
FLWGAHPVDPLSNGNLVWMPLPDFEPVNAVVDHLTLEFADQKFEGTWAQVAPEGAKSLRDALFRTIDPALHQALWEPAELEAIEEKWRARFDHLDRVGGLFNVVY